MANAFPGICISIEVVMAPSAERAAHVDHMHSLLRALGSVVTWPVDIDAWRSPSAVGPSWPTEQLIEDGVVANFHLARTAVLSCIDHCTGLSAVASLEPAPMLAAAALARSAVEAAGQAWWLRQPLTPAADELGESVWEDLGSRAGSTASAWYKWSAVLQEHMVIALQATAVRAETAGMMPPSHMDAASLSALADGAELARESARVLRDHSGLDVPFAYKRAAEELLEASGVRGPAGFYARVCEAAHGNPLAITRSDPRPELLTTGLMPITATPASTGDDDSVDVFLLVTIRCIETMLLDGFRPSAGRVWGLEWESWVAVQHASAVWQAQFRPRPEL